MPTLLIALLLGIYLGGDLNGWWGKASPKVDQANEAADLMTQNTDQSIAVLSTDEPDYATPTPLPTPVTEIRPPDFALPDLFDESVTYSLSRYKGQPIILNFWASWCAPCRAEMPALQKAYEKYADDGLVILAINQTFIDDIDAAREFSDELGLTFPLLRDDDGRISESLYGVRGLPTTVVIRADGTTAFAQIGPMTDEMITDVSRRLVTGEAVP